MGIGVVVDADNIIQTTVDGIPPLRDKFLGIVNGRDEQPNFKSLWHDFLQEEGKIQIKSTYSKEENHAHVASMKRGKKYFSPKKFHHQKEKEHNGNFDKSKLKCYNWNKEGHNERPQ